MCVCLRDESSSTSHLNKGQIIPCRKKRKLFPWIQNAIEITLNNQSLPLLANILWRSLFSTQRKVFSIRKKGRRVKIKVVGDRVNECEATHRTPGNEVISPKPRSYKSGVAQTHSPPLTFFLLLLRQLWKEKKFPSVVRRTLHSRYHHSGSLPLLSTSEQRVCHHS